MNWSLRGFQMTDQARPSDGDDCNPLSFQEDGYVLQAGLIGLFARRFISGTAPEHIRRLLAAKLVGLLRIIRTEHTEEPPEHPRQNYTYAEVAVRPPRSAAYEAAGRSSSLA